MSHYQPYYLDNYEGVYTEDDDFDREENLSPDSSVIVISDDDTDFSEILSEELEELGYAVVMADNPSDLPSIVSQYKPAAIILDHYMPTKNGADLFVDLETEGLSVDSARILMSAKREVKQIARELGAAFIEKPFVIDELVALIDRVVKDTGRELAQPKRDENDTESPRITPNSKSKTSTLLQDMAAFITHDPR